jgi:formyl-CoA transferase
MATGLYSGIAILMAIIERQRSGRGQYLDMTLYDCAISLMHPHLSNWLMAGKVPLLSGNAHTNIAPYDKFKTRTGEIFLGTGNDRTFRKFCEVIGKPEMGEDPRFRRNTDRLAHVDEMRREIETVLANRDAEEVCSALLEAGVPGGPVLNTDQVMEAEHTAHRNMKVALDWYKGAGTPIKLSRTPGGPRRPPPAFAEHSREILAEYGYSEEEIGRLKTDGILVEERR